MILISMHNTGINVKWQGGVVVMLSYGGQGGGCSTNGRGVVVMLSYGGQVEGLYYSPLGGQGVGGCRELVATGMCMVYTECMLTMM